MRSDKENKELEEAADQLADFIILIALNGENGSKKDEDNKE